MFFYLQEYFQQLVVLILELGENSMVFVALDIVLSSLVLEYRNVVLISIVVLVMME